MAHSARVRVLFVCLGNICRSPIAEGVLRQKVQQAGLSDLIHVASAGTGDWHVGEAPDHRMTAAAQRRGVDISHQRAQQVGLRHLAEYDLVLVMDQQNLENTRRLDPEGAHHPRIRLFREFDPSPGDRQVPDPYYGGKDGFDHVLDIVERTSEALLRELREEHGL
jgi:protein-tyrosine phosphatase